MHWVDKIKKIKFLLIVFAVIIAVASLLFSHFLMKDLSREEYQKMAIWAEAMRTLNNADETTDLNLVLRVLNGNSTIPVVVLDRNGEILIYRNIKIKGKDTLSCVKKESDLMCRSGDTMRIQLHNQEKELENDYIKVCYAKSSILRRLAYFPYVQLGVVLIFVLVAVFALLSSKKAEQNKVWVGLSKETAHQLGTPISSLMAWVEMLKESYPQDSLVGELEKDVQRLQLVAERFSRIGSETKPVLENLNELVIRVVEYMSHRTSKKVDFRVELPQHSLEVHLVEALFEWVMENLCKNAIDAMEGKGTILIKAWEDNKNVFIEVTDSGKGIPRGYFKSVFLPGFTTKKRGWGLGLSLAKRIVEEYHKGKIFVKNSEIGKGTTFRIELKK